MGDGGSWESVWQRDTQRIGKAHFRGPVRVLQGRLAAGPGNWVQMPVWMWAAWSSDRLAQGWKAEGRAWCSCSEECSLPRTDLCLRTSDSRLFSLWTLSWCLWSWTGTRLLAWLLFWDFWEASSFLVFHTTDGHLRLLSLWPCYPSDKSLLVNTCVHTPSLLVNTLVCAHAHTYFFSLSHTLLYTQTHISLTHLLLLTHTHSHKHTHTFLYTYIFSLTYTKLFHTYTFSHTSISLIYTYTRMYICTQILIFFHGTKGFYFILLLFWFLFILLFLLSYTFSPPPLQLSPVTPHAPSLPRKSCLFLLQLSLLRMLTDTEDFCRVPKCYF